MQTERKKLNEKVTRGEHAGVVATPAALADDMASKLPPGPVLDPACGEGSLLAAVRRRVPDTELHGIEVDPETAERARQGLTAANIVTGDALANDFAWPPGTSIIANPPWLSFSGRHASPQESAERKRFAPHYAGQGWPSLQSAFLERIAQHVARAGTAAEVLVPASMTELDRYAGVRAAVLEHTHLACAPVELGERAFPGVTEPAVWLSLRPSEPGKPGKGDVDTVNTGGSWTSTPESERVLLARLERFPRLPAKSFADPGVHSGNAARELVLPEGSNGPGLRQGRDLVAFHLGPPSARIDAALEPGGHRRFRRGPLERYAGFPVLLRQTADRPIAALHEPPTYFRNSLLACRAVPGLDPAFVVAVLNGPVAATWQRWRFRDARQRSFPQVKVGHLDTQPFPFIERAANPVVHDRIAARVRSMVRSKPEAPEFDANCALVRREVLEAFGLEAEWARRIETAAAGS